MAVRSAQAVWKGNLREGTGSVKTESGAVDGSYSYVSRFEEGSGTNPEELLGAAHAGCFSMALASALSREGFTVNSIETTAKVSLNKTEAGNTITQIDLVTKGDVDGIDAAKFQEIAEGTKKGCPVSRALSAVPMTVEATLA